VNDQRPRLPRDRQLDDRCVPFGGGGLKCLALTADDAPELLPVNAHRVGD
jgi:hypothetical protein